MNLCLYDLIGFNLEPLKNNDWKYMSPREVANIICDDIIPKLDDDDEYESWKESKSLIRSFLLQNDCDLFRVSLMGCKGLENGITNLWESNRFRPPLPDGTRFEKLLKERFPDSNQKWIWITRVVAHEMSPKLSEVVESVSSDLGDLSRTSGEKLLSAINDGTQRNLTSAESEYLQSLIKRAHSVDIFQFPSENTGLVSFAWMQIEYQCVLRMRFVCPFCINIT